MSELLFAGHTGTLVWKIALNLSRPGLITIFILYELRQFVINIWPVDSSTFQYNN